MKEDALEDMQKAHEDQLNKLTALTKEREIAWNKQKEEIEAHYSQLLNEVQSRSKVRSLKDNIMVCWGFFSKDLPSFLLSIFCFVEESIDG